MNAGTNFVLILSLLLALAVGSSAINEQRNEESDPTSPSRIAINHNETMLSAAAPAYAWSDWLTDIQAFFFSKPTGGGCDEWGCGGNHNETMLSDTAPVQQASMLSSLLFSTDPLPVAAMTGDAAATTTRPCLVTRRGFSRRRC